MGKIGNMAGAHPRHHRHSTPSGTSWLNLAERFCVEISDKRPRRGALRSVDELVGAIRDYICRHHHWPGPRLVRVYARGDIVRKR